MRLFCCPVFSHLCCCLRLLPSLPLPSSSSSPLRHTPFLSISCSRRYDGFSTLPSWLLFIVPWIGCVIRFLVRCCRSFVLCCRGIRSSIICPGTSRLASRANSMRLPHAMWFGCLAYSSDLSNSVLPPPPSRNWKNPMHIWYSSI